MIQDLWNQFWQHISGWANDPNILRPAIVGLFLVIVGLARTYFAMIGRMIVKGFKWLIAKLSRRGEDYDFQRYYLDWIIKQCRYISPIPAPIVIRKWNSERKQYVDLEKVYVRLEIGKQSGDEDWALRYGRGRSSWHKRPWFELPIIRLLLRLIGLHSLLLSRKETYKPGDISLVIDRHKRLVIRGNPGSGKTTLIKFLAITCARSLRNNKKKGDSPNLVREKLFWDKKPFPILVTLRRHGNVATWSPKRELTDIFLEELSAEQKNKCPNGFFERKLKKGNCLVLFDGFDELGTRELRNIMAQKIAGFLNMYDREDNRIVVTTRKFGYEGQLEPYEFAVYTVQDLNAGEIRALIKLRYEAIMASEIKERDLDDADDIMEILLPRSALLIERIESTPRLGQLATNPMLLSLIVLIHSLQMDLPEERVHLYRNCVEILTEWWQRSKFAELGLTRNSREDLSLDQKLTLLYEIAFAMQQQRQDEGSPAVIPKEVAQGIIVSKLQGFAVRGGSSGGQETDYYIRAAEWIEGIQTDSGILIELGSDLAGKPMISFSHLTFQEYMAAVAASKNETYQVTLFHNFLRLTWRDVVLLYAASVSDATSIVSALLNASDQPYGVVLAGYCLAERLQKLDAVVQHRVVKSLEDNFIRSDDNTVGEFAKVMATLDLNEVTVFLITQIYNSSEAKRLAAIKALGQTNANNAEIVKARQALVGILETGQDISTVVASRESLARIGDPRFLQDEPVMEHIFMPALIPTASFRRLKDLFHTPVWTNKGMIARCSLLYNFFSRYIDIQTFIFWYTLRRQSKSGEIDICKYPITNIEYRRFVSVTGYPAPKHWLEGTYPIEEATHPVRGIRCKDAGAYCKWLSKRTGWKYRLPTEWEWEWAATGDQGWLYPWGDQFDKGKCNTKESDKAEPTPVGSYLAGVSPHGLSDMCGNVWEITTTVAPSFIIPIIALLVAAVILTISSNSVGNQINIGFSNSIIGAIIGAISIMIYTNFSSELSGSYSAYTVMRGGDWETPAANATCYIRRKIPAAKTGFRCVREKR